MAKLNLPQSYGEREKLAKYIRQTLNTYNLRNNWLIATMKTPRRSCDFRGDFLRL